MPRLNDNQIIDILEREVQPDGQIMLTIPGEVTPDGEPIKALCKNATGGEIIQFCAFVRGEFIEREEEQRAKSRRKKASLRADIEREGREARLNKFRSETATDYREAPQEVVYDSLEEQLSAQYREATTELERLGRIVLGLEAALRGMGVDYEQLKGGDNRPQRSEATGSADGRERGADAEVPATESGETSGGAGDTITALSEENLRLKNKLEKANLATAKIEVEVDEKDGGLYELVTELRKELE